MAKYDLLHTMSKFLDTHLIFPLLEFTQSRGIYNDEDILRAKIELLSRTNMVDYAIDIYKMVNNTDAASSELLDRRKEVVARMRELQQDAQPITEFLSDPAKIESLRGEKTHNSSYMQEEYGIGPAQIDALFHFAKFQFDCGNYEASSEFLHHFRTYSLDTDKNLSALWGKLASEILMTQYDSALETLNRLKELIDTHLFSDALKQLQQRTWLLHWSLFVFWNIEDGRSKLIDTFMTEKFMAALQINAPHLLRYLAAAYLVSKGDKDRSQKWKIQLKNLVTIIVHESYQYSDPVSDFLKCVYKDYNFDLAQDKLRECEILIDNDYFLAGIKSTFMEQARMAIFEVYCRIHQCIDLNMLSDRLGMERTEAEKWIATLIRNARLNARYALRIEMR